MEKRSKLTHLINHVAFIVDASSSMGPHRQAVIRVFDNQIKYLSRKSQEVGQETRVSVYMFENTVSNLVYDIDVMRLPSLTEFYKTHGNTALMDGIIQGVNDLEKTPELYGDHAFLIYTITDGEENCSKIKKEDFVGKIGNLPENWTLIVYVPDGDGVAECKSLGIPKGNIDKWNINSTKGMEEVEKSIEKSSEIFFAARTQGIRGSKNLLTLDISQLSLPNVQMNLVEIDPSSYIILKTPPYIKGKKIIIRPFVESYILGNYTPGSTYYQLTKRETIQKGKIICIKHKKNGKVYSGPQARDLIRLPSHEVQIDPAFSDTFDIFIQSTSTNRILMPNTEVIVFF